MNPIVTSLIYPVNREVGNHWSSIHSKKKQLSYTNDNLNKTRQIMSGFVLFPYKTQVIEKAIKNSELGTSEV